LAAADGAGRLDHVVCHSSLFSVPHPGNTTAAAALHQPGARVAAVDQFEPARALPPTLSSLGASPLAEAFNDSSAFSSEFPSAGDRQAVAAVGSALAATADPFSVPAMRRKQSAFRVAAASVIAEQQTSISTSGV
jgi:hypothetical protein